MFGQQTTHDPHDMDDDVDDVENTEDCAMCGGPAVVLGTLGNVEHFRCRNCGAEQSRRVS